MFNKLNRTFVAGKPYFGIHIRKRIVFNPNGMGIDFGDANKMFSAPQIKEFIAKLKYIPNELSDLQITDERIVVKKPYKSGDYLFNTTISISFLASGRAWKVMKLVKKGIKRTKKIIVNGKRRRIRIDV